MAKVIIYNPNGDEVEVEAIDAKEYCDFCGYTLTPPVKPGGDDLKPVRKSKSKGMVEDAGENND